MDKIILHPQAQNLLFKYYRVLRLIFNDVLGHLELDYISMAILNKTNDLCFISSMPAIEQNLIEHQLWERDLAYQSHFFDGQDILIWNEVYLDGLLKHFKCCIPKLEFAISIPSDYQQLKVVYSFGLKSSNPYSHIRLLENQETLLSIGKYALSKIIKIIENDIFTGKPNLKLIINQ